MGRALGAVLRATSYRHITKNAVGNGSNGAKLLVLFNEGKSRTLLLSRCRLLSSSGVISFGIRVVELVVRRFEKCRATNYRHNVIRIGAMERSKALVSPSVVTVSGVGGRRGRLRGDG